MVSFLTTALQVFCVETVSVLGLVALLYGYMKVSKPHHI